MKNKAEFQGECQVCGRVQKLPDNKLSKHGYHIRWNIFDGVCPGAHKDPFEISKDLVEGAIKRATERSESLHKAAEKRLQSKDPNDVWYRVYGNNSGELNHWVFKSQFGESSHEFQGRLEQIDNKIFFIFNYNNKEHQYDTRTWATSVEEVMTKANTTKAWEFEQEAEMVDNYIAWQTRRLKNWQPKPLTPVK